jgi:hypothetical protein
MSVDTSMPSRQTAVTKRLDVNAIWWDRQLVRLRLPGGPLLGATLSRTDLWGLAAGAADDDEAALRLLWHALAWGAGLKLRQCRKRLEFIADNPGPAAQKLRQAASLSTSDPKAAYAVLHPDGYGVLGRLGPAFGTKYLYFAGGGASEHPCLILDRRVAQRLHHRGWTSLGLCAWPTWTYGRYCDLLARWVKEAPEGHPVSGDQIEYWLFMPG